MTQKQKGQDSKLQKKTKIKDSHKYIQKKTKLKRGDKDERLYHIRCRITPKLCLQKFAWIEAYGASSTPYRMKHHYLNQNSLERIAIYQTKKPNS